MQKPIYEIHSNIDEKNPIICHECYLDDKMTCYPNWHENIEILCMLSGRAEITIDSVSFFAKRGDIAVVNSGREHMVRAVDGSTRYRCVIIDSGFCAFLGFSVNEQYIKEKITDGEIYRIIGRIAEENEKRDTYYEPALKYLSSQLLVELYRRYANASVKIGKESSKSEAVKNAAMFINAHCTENIAIDEIAGYVNVSKYYLCRIFKEVMGITMVEYINFRRCRKAHRLLQKGNMSIGQVAEVCGFDNMSYFSKIYKKHMNMLPSEQKKIIKDGTFL